MRGVTDLNGSFDSYCNGCEFREWCTRESKPFKLQTTVDAIELYTKKEDKLITFGFNEYNQKAYDYMLMVKSEVDKLKPKE